MPGGAAVTPDGAKADEKSRDQQDRSSCGDGLRLKGSCQLADQHRRADKSHQKGYAAKELSVVIGRK